MRKLTLFIVSDSVGETADLVAKAAASQFRQGLETVVMKRFSHVEDESQLKEIVYLAERQDAIIIYTLVKSSMRRNLKEECGKHRIHCIDLMGPIVDLISVELDEQPIEEPGLVRQLDEDYYKKIEAIEFAVKYDDGGIQEAFYKRISFLSAFQGHPKRHYHSTWPINDTKSPTCRSCRKWTRRKNYI